MIPIGKIIEKDHAIQCNIDDEPGKIEDMESDTFSAFVSGDILGRRLQIAQQCSEGLLGSYSGNPSSRDSQ